MRFTVGNLDLVDMGHVAEGLGLMANALDKEYSDLAAKDRATARKLRRRVNALCKKFLPTEAA